MVITYQGDNYFRFQSGDLTLLVDPTNQRAFKGAGVVLSTISTLNGIGDFVWGLGRI